MSNPITPEIVIRATELLKAKQSALNRITQAQADLEAVEKELETAIPPELQALLNVAINPTSTSKRSSSSTPAGQGKPVSPADLKRAFKNPLAKTTSENQANSRALAKALETTGGEVVATAKANPTMFDVKQNGPQFAITLKK